MPRDRAGRGRDEPPGYDAPVYEGPVYDMGGGNWGDATWPGQSRRSGQPRSAIHDPWREPRHLSLPSGLPTGPTLFVVAAAIVLAFLLGRASGGGGETEAAAGSAETTSTVLVTTLPPIVHTVQENESLSSIATHYGLTTAELASFNGITDVNHVEEGQQILIPAPTTPTVPTTATTAKKQNKKD